MDLPHSPICSSNAVLRFSPSLNSRLRRHYWFCKYICYKGPFRIGGVLDRVVASVIPGRLKARYGGFPSLSRVVWGYFSRMLLPKLEERTIISSLLGYDFCVSPESGENYYKFGVYEPTTLQVMRMFLGPGDTFVDAGASFGQMSLVASGIVGTKGTVLSFEPMPLRFCDLLASIKINKASNVLAFNAALGSGRGSAKLYWGGMSPSMIRPRIKSPDEKSTGKASQYAEVKMLSLTEVLKIVGIDSVDLIKIDVEGFELDVLKGALTHLLRDRPPVLLFEYGAYEDNSGILSFIKSCNTAYKFFAPEFGNHNPVVRLQEISSEDDIHYVANVLGVPKHRMTDLESCDGSRFTFSAT